MNIKVRNKIKMAKKRRITTATRKQDAGIKNKARKNSRDETERNKTKQHL